MPTLTIQSDVLPTKEYELTKPEITVGRIEGNDIQIEHGSVSGHHAVLIKQGGDYLVRDNNSTNGTSVNGTKVSEHLLKSGDVVYFGYIQATYYSTTGAGGVPLPDPSSGRDFHMASESTLPPNFTNHSPFGRKTEESSSKPLDMANAALAVAAVLAVGFVVFRFIS